LKLEKKEKNFIVKTGEGNNFTSRAIVIASGAVEKELGIEGEKKFTNLGVSYCAICDGFLFRNQEVAVVGGGYSALETALYMSNVAKKVYFIHRRSEFRAEPEIVIQAQNNLKIIFLLNSVLTEIQGSEAVEKVLVSNLANNEKSELLVKAVFPCIGLAPFSSFAHELGVCDQENYIAIKDDCSTAVSGLFAAGDVARPTPNKIKQIVTAVAEGAIAAQSDFVVLENIFSKLKGKTVLVIDHHYEIFKYVDYIYQFTGEKLIRMNKKEFLADFDLTYFENFTNLESLSITATSFSGSLKPLQKLSKLKGLCIEGTDISSGLAFLPNSVDQLRCDSVTFANPINSNPQAAKIRKLLVPYEYNIKNWRKDKEIWQRKGFIEIGNDWDREYVEAAKTGEDDLMMIGGSSVLIELLRESNKLFAKDGYGELDLKNFINLKKINCQNNQLTNLRLKDWKNLLEFNCANNKFVNLDFLNSATNLEKLDIQNTQELSHQGLKVFSRFKNLKHLNVSQCPFGGSLKPLQSINELETLDITGTDISEGLEYLPESCEKLYCNSDDEKSVKIIEIMDKSNCAEYEDKDGKDVKYYNLNKWRADQANNATASAIPLERLFVIRSNLQQLLKKWGSEDKDNKTKLEKLRSPEQFGKFNYLTGVEYASTATTVVGGALTLLDFSTTGGVITLTAPLIEDFKKDADGFLDNYNALRGIMKQVEIALKNLKKAVNTFLKEYDKDGNGEIDIEELTDKRKKFANELGKVKGIIKAIQNLEDKIIQKLFLNSKKIAFLLKGKKNNQVLVVNSHLVEYKEDGEKKVSDVEIVKNPCQKILSGQIREGVKEFNSQGEAIEKYLEIIEIKLDEEQREQIRERVQQDIEDEKNDKIPEEASKKIQGRLNKLLEKKLLEKEKNELQKSDRTEQQKEIKKSKGKSKEVISELTNDQKIQGFKYEGYDSYLCPYHASQIEDMLRRQRQDRNRPQDEYEQYPGCIFGKRNKKTKECNESFVAFIQKNVNTAEEEEELERLNQKAKKHDEEIKELEKDLKETDRDEIADLSSDKKRLCCEYQKNIEEKERILKDKNNYSPFSNNNSSDTS
ncbi:6696_t:CDS:10, partial [Racocetra fulgida]